MRYISESALRRCHYEWACSELGMMITVVYATKKAQFIKRLELAASCTVLQAIEQSGVLEIHPEISLQVNRVGIYNEITSLDASVKANDRVEIYCPLLIDPMEARRLRAKAKI